MSETAEFKRGAGGRPTRAEAERRLANLLETAMQLFLERGYAAVSVEQIAKRAGVAKRFIYARYDDKAELFGAAIERAFLGRFEELLRGFEPTSRGVEPDLYDIGRKLVSVATEPQAIALHRLFIASAPLFPDLSRRFVERNRRRAFEEVGRVFAFHAQRGEIQLPHPQLTIEQFLISVVGLPQRLALLGLNETAEEQDQRLRLAVRLFVRGCATGKPRA